jgi:L-ribulose-5-phosphate 3-epimerase
MKKSISIWSFPGGLEGTYDLRDAFDKARAADFDAMELAISATGVLTLDTSEEQARALADDASKFGIEISSLAVSPTWDNLITSNDEATRQKAKQIVRRALEMAMWLSTKTILILPGAVDATRYPDQQPVPYDVAYDRLLAALQDLAPVAENYQVNLAFENVWNKFLFSPLEVRDLIDKVGSAYVGIHLDTGNVIQIGYPEHWIRILGHRIKGIHLKDFRETVRHYPEGVVDLLGGDVNWPAVVEALREIDYDGYLVAEADLIYRYHWDLRLTLISLAVDRILGSA